ncbi:Splicing factor YJU2 [Taenia solium]|eukprot:TsM_000524200 transcript=TsM_000524200 gene=TsM_000524200
MTERKVLNKYFPPDYDPSKIPRLKRGSKSRQFNIRTMAPFNMRCLTCNGYIYKAKKFNSRMETAEGVDYLGLRHYRFYIRCPGCCAEIIWRTDLESNDYVIESGAKRNFEALKTAEELEAKRAAQEEEELANNPMKLLEKRTNQSKYEMETAEAIDDLKEMNKRQATMETDNFLLRKLWQEQEAEKAAQEKADEDFIKEVMEAKNKGMPPSEIVEKFGFDGQVQGPTARDEEHHEVIPSSEMVSKPKPPQQRPLGSFSTSHRDLIRNSIRKRPLSASTTSEAPEELKKAQNSPEPSGRNPLGIAYSSDDSSSE